MGLQVAGDSIGGFAMKNSGKTNLALERLLLIAAVLRIVNEVVELLSKVVNYDVAFPKLRLQVSK